MLNLRYNPLPQLFVGPNCTAPPAQVYCSCLHLTDFSGGVAPRLAVASLAQMVSLSPRDLFAKLGILSAIIFSLLGGMLLFSAVAFVYDTHGRDRLFHALRSPLFQFREDPATGAWTWVLRQGRVEDDIGHLSGPLAELAKAMGAPPVRIRRVHRCTNAGRDC